jgi:hypothetical protein
MTTLRLIDLSLRLVANDQLCHSPIFANLPLHVQMHCCFGYHKLIEVNYAQVLAKNLTKISCAFLDEEDVDLRMFTKLRDCFFVHKLTGRSKYQLPPNLKMMEANFVSRVMDQQEDYSGVKPQAMKDNVHLAWW